MAKITRTNPEGISKPFSNYSHVVTAEGAQKLVFCKKPAKSAHFMRICAIGEGEPSQVTSPSAGRSLRSSCGFQAEAG